MDMNMDTTTTTILTEAKIKERFIPISRQEIIKNLLAAPHWQPQERTQFSAFCTVLTALYHFKFHADLEKLKQSYFPFNPDHDLPTQHHYSDAEKQGFEQQFATTARQLLVHANYEELMTDKVNAALSEESFYGVKVHVDLDDFSEILLYYRGASAQTEYQRHWKTLFLFKTPLVIPIYKKLFVLVKFKAEAVRAKELAELMVKQKSKLSLEQALKKTTKVVKKRRRHIPEDVEDKIFMKLFKDIPRSDLDMLFPNQEVRLKLVDKIKLAVSGGSGTIGGIIGIFAKITTAVTNPFLLVGAFVGLIGVFVRQILNIFNYRTKYMMVLSRNLYFHTMNNNFGVINGLVDEAEEEETKEAILAYYFLLLQRDKNYTKERLDRQIESYLQQRYNVTLDFEVDDGIRKLREEGLLKEDANGVLSVLELTPSCQKLDQQWDNFFKF